MNKYRTYRLEFLSLDELAVLEARVYDTGGTGRLHLGRVHEDGVDPVEIRIDHDRRAAAQIDVLLPPVGHVVARPPGLEGHVAL